MKEEHLFFNLSLLLVLPPYLSRVLAMEIQLGLRFDAIPLILAKRTRYVQIALDVVNACVFCLRFLFGFFVKWGFLRQFYLLYKRAL